MNSSMSILMRASRFRIGKVGEPFEFGGKFGEVAELGGSKRAPERNRARVGDSNEILFSCRRPPVFPGCPTRIFKHDNVFIGIENKFTNR